MVAEKICDSLNQSERTNSERTDGEPEISELEMLKNGSLEVPQSPNSSEKDNSGPKTPTSVKKTDEESKVSNLEIANNGGCDRLDMPRSPNPSEKSSSDCKTLTPVKLNEQKPQLSGIEFPKNATPDRLKVPKAFKFPERYTSPTDSLMSPITRGLLARSRRGGPGGALLPPSKNHLKMQDLRISEMNLLYQS